jgi:enoyl-CoA hydratase/carnithine racemase
MYTGDTVDAHEAQRLGLVQAVLADEGFDDRVLELAGRIASGSPSGLALMKRLAAEPPDDEALERELAGTLDLLAGSDAREGLAAFVERRAPRFHDDEER